MKAKKKNYVQRIEHPKKLNTSHSQLQISTYSNNEKKHSTLEELIHNLRKSNAIYRANNSKLEGAYKERGQEIAKLKSKVSKLEEFRRKDKDYIFKLENEIESLNKLILKQQTLIGKKQEMIDFEGRTKDELQKRFQHLMKKMNNT